jgi:hypothetical protein
MQSYIYCERLLLLEQTAIEVINYKSKSNIGKFTGKRHLKRLEARQVFPYSKTQKA